MKQLNLFLAVLALTIIAFFPAAARADDALEGLDVTMMVLDNAEDFEDSMSEMDGPDDSAVKGDDWRDGEDGNDEGEPEEDDESDDESESDEDEESEDESNDEFGDEIEDESNDEFEGNEGDEEYEMDDEDDHEDRDDVDDDEVDEVEEEEPEDGDDVPD